MSHLLRGVCRWVRLTSYCGAMSCKHDDVMSVKSVTMRSVQSVMPYSQRPQRAGMPLVIHLQTGQRWVLAVVLEGSLGLEVPAGISDLCNRVCYLR